MNTLPLTRHQLNPDPPIKRILIGAVAVLAIGLTVVIIALSTTSGTHSANATADPGQTLMHFYGTGAPPSTRAAQPKTPSRQAPSQHFYGLQP
jgi:hypothetical protein